MLLKTLVLRSLALKLYTASCLFFLAVQPANADFFGEAGVEYQYFTDTPAFAGQGDDALSATFEPTWSFSSDDNNNLYDIKLFARKDGNDDERSHVDIRELSWIHTRGDWEFRTGIRKVFWGVAETQHLVDIINQTDAVDRPDGEVKLGQPMINVSRLTDIGDFDLYVLPYFRERSFAGRAGRFRPELIVEQDKAQYESADEKSNIDYAARWSHSLGVWDLGLSYFTGTGREPVLRPDETGQSLMPTYIQIDQLGLDAQATVGSWLYKLEAIDRKASLQFPEQSFSSIVLGFEKTFFDLKSTGADLGLVYEYFDNKPDNGEAVDGAHFVGLRLALNDEQSTDLLLGCDAEVNVCQLEGSRRIGDNKKISIRANSFSNLDETPNLSFLENDSYIQLNLSYFF